MKIAGREIANAEQYFVKRTQKGAGCWLWIGTIDKNGYGVWTHNHVITTASRASWVLHRGPIKSRSTFVCHHCDNPSCVRPDHLFLGSQADNIRDAQIKGRLNVPSKGWKRRITHCPQGHEYSEENTYRWKTRRICRKCHATHARKSRAAAR